MPKPDLKKALCSLQISDDTENEFDAILLNSQTPKTGGSKIENLPLYKLVDYADEEFKKITGRPQPFHLYNDEDLSSLAQSIKDNGVMQPVIVRPMNDGTYQVIAGRNRCRAARLCGCTEIPAIIKNGMSDYDAAMFMLDTNLEQRHKLIYSEKAYAYKMRLDLQRRKGQRSDIKGKNKVDTLSEVGRQNNESRRTVAYLIRLTFLLPELLAMVDSGDIGFKAGVAMSYLSKETQYILLKDVLPLGIKPNHKSIDELRRLDENGEADKQSVLALFEEKQKPKSQKITLNVPQLYEFRELLKDKEEVERLFIEFLKSYTVKSRT